MTITPKIILTAILIAAAITGCKDPENGNETVDIKVTTYAPTEITATTAQCGGHVTTSQAVKIAELGVCWATEANPTATDAHLSTTTTGEPFNCTLVDLLPATQYHVRAYALVSSEYHYGEDMTFTTLENGGGGTDPNLPEGTLKGVFSVSESLKVRFAQGNLQYQASTNTWRFADKQTDIIGEDNINISASYDGWIDLFAWGTSGYEHGAVCYQPWSTSQTYNDYYAYGNYMSNLYDQTGQADWGYNAISNGGDQTGQWRTLTAYEWRYIFNRRETPSGIRFAVAKIEDQYGILLFPDDWAVDNYIINAPNDLYASYETNTITATSWNELESIGVVFLPAAGLRIEVGVPYLNKAGAYWSSTAYNYTYSNYIYFIVNEEGDTSDVTNREYGISVRLAQDYTE